MSIDNIYQRRLDRINKKHQYSQAYDSSGEKIDLWSNDDDVTFKQELTDKGVKKLNRLNS